MTRRYIWAIACAFVVLAGCAETVRDPLPGDEGQRRARLSSVQEGENLAIVTDEETGCQYIVAGNWRGMDIIERRGAPCKGDEE